MGLVLALGLVAAGCKGLPDPCDDFPDRTCIALTIDVASNGPRLLDAVGIKALSGLTLPGSEPVRGAQKGGLIAPPALIAIVPTALTSGTVSVEIDGFDKGALVGYATFTTTLAAAHHASGHVTLGGPPSDMATTPPDLLTPDLALPPCDPVAQSGCATGQKCTVASGIATCTHAGTVKTGATCTTNPDTCVPGDICYANAYCEQFCNSDGDCTPNGTPPLSANNIARCAFTLGMTSFHACSIPCNPVPAAGASGCPTSSKCDATSAASGAELTHCNFIGAGTDGTSCAKNGDCAAGFGCFNHNSGPSSCRRYCRKANNADCAASAGYTCQSPSAWTFMGACCPPAGC